MECLAEPGHQPPINPNVKHGLREPTLRNWYKQNCSKSYINISR